MCPSVAPLQSSFEGGEVSPLLQGRVDADRYKKSLALCKNWIPLLQGPLKRRSGTKYVATANTGSVYAPKLIPFNFSTTQAYILEFGHEYIRFYANYGQVQLLGSPYELETTYQYTDLSKLKFVQSADVLYITHPDYSPAKLQRLGATNWTLQAISFQDGPYDSINTTKAAITPGAAAGLGVTFTMGPAQTITNAVNDGSGKIKITIAAHGWASGQQVTIFGIVGTTEANTIWTIDVVDANNFTLRGSVFVHAYISGGTLHPTTPFHVASTKSGINIGYYTGTPIRVEIAGSWGWAILNTIFNDYTFTADIVQTLGGTTASISWAIGIWPGTSYRAGPSPSNHVGVYPSTATFHEDRLGFAGTPTFPQRVDLSQVSNYENMGPTKFDGSVVSSNAVSLFLNSTDVNLTQWLGSDEKGLLTGSTSAEWLIRPSQLGEAITPTNLLARRGSKWGSANFASFLVGKATLFIQRGARKLRELVFDFYIDGYRANDLTELAEHITGEGVVDWAYQSIPISAVWLVREDGALLGMTYDRDMTQLRTGWHWHVLGGSSDASGTPAAIESVAIIPSPDGTRDDVWLAVKRYINGSLIRTIEYMNKIYEDIDEQQNAVFLDASSTYDSPITITGATQANPIVVHAASHGFSTGNYVRIDDVKGMKDSNGNSLLNTKWFKITVTDADHFSLQNNDTGANVDGSAATAYVSDGEVRKLITTISGANYLEGETVSILADGAVQAPQVVSSGAITLPQKAAVVTLGYSYNSDGKLLRFEAGARNGTSMAKTRRTHRLGLLVHQSQGLSIGKDFDNLDLVQFRTQGVDPNTGASPLSSGMESHPIEMDYDFDNQICFRANQPLPCAILGVYPMLETQDRA